MNIFENRSIAVLRHGSANWSVGKLTGRARIGLSANRPSRHCSLRSLTDRTLQCGVQISLTQQHRRIISSDDYVRDNGRHAVAVFIGIGKAYILIEISHYFKYW